jgi:valyl-tRNA synthetase
MLPKQYSSAETEQSWYAHWMSRGYFRSVPDEREPFTIVIPPPNVTGVLHMGHMLNNTIQDILVRKARMEGKNACWVPGTDHASIATEAKVVGMLREQGIRKADITREQFLEHAFAWKDKYGGIILDQLKTLGASCDWDRTRFTMEPKLSAAVIKVFVDLYKKGKLYRAHRMVNWDVEAKTVLSNEEVVYHEEQAQLFHVLYRLEGSETEGITIATQRPETIFADVAVAVNPNDERYAHLVGKRVRIPLIDRPIPVIADDYVDQAFGTGALKITPAHDQNDYAIGQRFGLEVIDVLNEDGTLNEHACLPELIGKDRFVARKMMKSLLDGCGALVKLEDYRTNIGRSERTNTVVEPRLSLQWFVDMGSLAKQALDAVEGGEVKFYPDHYRNMYRHWMSNIRDWCVSRQLWWGQRIPAWYYGEQVFVEETAEAALESARKATGNAQLQLSDLRQEEDVVDTWFSSWLWPISVFDGFESEKEVSYYYPTSVLVTGWDIIFFWVARMVMAGYEWRGERPFEHVYFTGMVRDQYRRKMSKSLGNSPDSMVLLQKYGADGVRFGLLSASPAGGDLVFDAPFDKATKQIINESVLCEQGRNFCNKLWNALRLVKGWTVSPDLTTPAANAYAVRWFEESLRRRVAEQHEMFAEYRLSEALKSLYTFIWDDFCSWYLEMVKPDFEKPIDAHTHASTLRFFESLIQLLHPFMPFVTEEIWHRLSDRAKGDDCIVSRYPAVQPFDKAFLYQGEIAKDVVVKVREARNNHQLKPRDPLVLVAQDGPSARAFFAIEGLRETIEKLAFLEKLEISDAEPQGTSFIAGTEKYFLAFEKVVDAEAEKEKLLKELEHARSFVASLQAKLSNEKFVSSAPAAVVDNERKKLSDGQVRLTILEEMLNKY